MLRRRSFLVWFRHKVVWECLQMCSKQISPSLSCPTALTQRFRSLHPTTAEFWRIRLNHYSAATWTWQTPNSEWRDQQAMLVTQPSSTTRLRKRRSIPQTGSRRLRAARGLRKPRIHTALTRLETGMACQFLSTKKWRFRRCRLLKDSRTRTKRWESRSSRASNKTSRRKTSCCRAAAHSQSRTNRLLSTIEECRI